MKNNLSQAFILRALTLLIFTGAISAQAKTNPGEAKYDSEIIRYEIQKELANPRGAEGIEGGGGSVIESGFKTKLLSIVDEIQNEMSESQHLTLKFDRNALDASLHNPTGFYVLCASSPIILKQLMDERKMARVFSEASHVVNLDCTNYSLKTWQRLNETEEPGELVFFLHEGLRIAGSEQENDMYGSSSYLDAKQSLLKIRTQAVADIVYGKNPKCTFKIEEISFYQANGHLTIFSLLQNGHLVLNINFRGVHDTVMLDLINNTTKSWDTYGGTKPNPQPQQNREIYAALKTFGCY